MEMGKVIHNHQLSKLLLIRTFIYEYKYIIYKMFFEAAVLFYLRSPSLLSISPLCLIDSIKAFDKREIFNSEVFIAIIIIIIINNKQ